jgi:membrane-associated phospholipid phosphatase
MRFLLLILIFAGVERLHAQQKDSTISFPGLQSSGYVSIPPTMQRTASLKPTFRRLIVPLALITYGAIAQSTEDMREFDVSVKTQVRKKDPDFHTPFDNYLQYTPALSVYALNAAGIKGKHDFKERTITYALAYLMMGVTVQSLKSITKVVRPDGRGTNAFPSGHTATAFSGAEFLRQEYKDVSPWYGIAGYTVATATGILRMYNNKHWLRDVVAGAGFGILATQMAYWIYPVIERKLFRNKTNRSVQLMY